MKSHLFRRKYKFDLAVYLPQTELNPKASSCFQQASLSSSIQQVSAGSDEITLGDFLNEINYPFLFKNFYFVWGLAD